MGADLLLGGGVEEGGFGAFEGPGEGDGLGIGLARGLRGAVVDLDAVADEGGAEVGGRGGLGGVLRLRGEQECEESERGGEGQG